MHELIINDEAGEAKELACFVIGPIGDKDALHDSPERRAYENAIQVLEEVIDPACAGFGISTVRADQISKPGEIPEQVYRNLRDFHLVIADLTGANPNVMYELGLRHASGKRTIQIGERGNLPFDVNVIRTILFKRTEGGLIEARRKLSAAIASSLETGGDPVTATRVWFESSVVDRGGTIQTGSCEIGEELDETDAELGFLEQLAEMSDAMDSASATLQTVTNVFSDIGSLADATTTELHLINASNGPVSARVAVTNRLAALLDDPATKLAILAGDYCRSVERMDAGVKYALNASRDAEPSTDSFEFREKVREMVATTEGTMASVEYFRNQALAVGNATRSFRIVNRRIANSLNQILGTKAIFASWNELL